MNTPDKRGHSLRSGALSGSFCVYSFLMTGRMPAGSPDKTGRKPAAGSRTSAKQVAQVQRQAHHGGRYGRQEQSGGYEKAQP